MSGLRFDRYGWSLSSFRRGNPYFEPKYNSLMGLVTGALPMILVVLLCIMVLIPRRFNDVVVRNKTETEEQKNPGAHQHLSTAIGDSSKQYLCTLIVLFVLLLSIIMSIGLSMERLVERNH